MFKQLLRAALVVKLNIDVKAAATTARAKAAGPAEAEAEGEDEDEDEGNVFSASTPGEELHGSFHACFCPSMCTTDTKSASNARKNKRKKCFGSSLQFSLAKDAGHFYWQVLLSWLLLERWSMCRLADQQCAPALHHED